MPADSSFAAAYSKDLVLVTAAWRGCLARFDDRLGAREPFLLVTGEPGTGKTTLVREAVDQWGGRARVVFVSNPMLERLELIEEIARRFGAEPPVGASKPQLIACLERALAEVANGSQVPVIVVEDAHQLGVELIDELRLLANSERQAERPLEIVLVGLPSLHESLMDPTMAPVLQRIAVHCQVAPLSHKQTRQYLHHRARAGGEDANVLFPREACRMIHDVTRGVPRAINSLAAEAMRLTREGSAETITVDRVEAAAANLSMAPLPPTPPIVAVAKADAKHEPKPQAKVEAKPEARHEAKPQPKPEPAATVRETAPTKARPVEATPVPTPAPSPEPVASSALPEWPQGAPEGPLEDRQDGPPEGPKADPTKVNDWVSRFTSTGPPRIGSALSAYGSFDPESIVEPTPDDGIAEASGDDATPRPAAAPAKPMKLIILDDLPDDLPSSSTPPPPPAPVRHRRNGLANSAAIAGAFAAAAIVTVLVLTRSTWMHVQHGRTARSAPDTAPVATVDTTLGAAPETSTRRIAATQSAAPVVTPVEEEATAADVAPTETEAESAPPPDPSPANAPAKKSRLGLEVGTYLDEVHAGEERDRLVSETGLKGWVVSGVEYGGTTYRIVLGVFSTEDRAEASANSLIERGLVSEARVVPMPSRHSRR